MIVADSDGAIRFVTQPDHAALAGRFADHWSNERFAEPTPRAATTVAAYRHDDGWIDYDRRPHLDDDGTPVDFRGMRPSDWIPIYDRGVDAVTAVDPYAGLLVSLHGAGLRRRRYGLSPSWPDTPTEYAEFVERQEEHQARLARELHGDGDRISEADLAALSTLHASGELSDGTDSRLWRNYRLLQAWDTLSLAFCTTVSPPSYRRIDAVPTARSDPDATLSIEPLGDSSFRVEPYPFDTDPLVVSVPTRTVGADSFGDETGLTRSYYEAVRTVEPFTLRRG